ncbi:hypothetical protein MNEG_1731 [Monoraphidium neglectum]|uniref:Uncharacterized protein n=1 Tax=Monoraphidium neglectum TaxID=145388 RepID=A0A0D2LIG2_9CHLO|nr:hypothetical protein MNEG_1731 [Monoraphidium neglectum]KIZ06219.1 hypothetical protein MNEG_1731 [Monoraphidium neglectum]|eukprot:XP_013905238.1 hypothetical protein MNEG_1731 [Monoraphidium neglectum]
MAKQALQSDPEAAAALKRYEDAVVRLEKARATERELESVMAEAAKAAALADAAAQASARVQAGQLMADAEVAAAEKLLRVAQIEHNLAEGEKARARGVAYSVMDRAESGKAAMVAVAGGLAAAVPLALAAADSAGGSASELLSFADVVCCSALFGVTYSVRRRQEEPPQQQQQVPPAAAVSWDLSSC